jgi:hypothetical protein
MPKPKPEPTSRVAREDDCAVCGAWPRTLRSTMRCAVNVLPLREQVCGKCFEAFWTNITAKTRAKGQRPS